MTKQKIQIFVFRQEHDVQDLTVINGFTPVETLTTNSKKIYDLVNSDKKSFLELVSKTETLIHEGITYSGKHDFLKKIAPKNLDQLFYSLDHRTEQENTYTAIQDDTELLNYLRFWWSRLNEMCIVFRRIQKPT